MSTLKPHILFNHFDSLAMSVGLKRRHMETNKQLKQRILAVFEEQINSSRQGLIYGISNELGLVSYNVKDRTFFFLTKQPLTEDQCDQLSATYEFTVKVDDGTITPQLGDQTPVPSGWEPRTDALSGWCCWHDNNSNYSQILEFIDAPPYGSEVSATYRYRDGDLVYTQTDKTDTQDPEDTSFTGYSKETVDGEHHVRVNALNDSEFLNDENEGFIDSVGRATNLYEKVVDRIHEAAPIYWGTKAQKGFIWGKTPWDVGDEELGGAEALPSYLDAETSGYLISTSGVTTPMEYISSDYL